MVKTLLGILGVSIATGTAVLLGLQQVDPLGVWERLFPIPPPDAAYQRGFRSDVMVGINRIRSSSGLSEIKGDEAIQGFLGSWISSISAPQDLSLDDVFDVVQSRFPGAQYLAANLVVSGSRENLMERISGWTAIANPDFDSVNTAVFRSGRQLGALAVMSRRIPEYSLKTLNDAGGRFYNRCPHCDKVHALELDRDSRTLILSCPHCDLPFEILAVGTDGRMRRANDFFEGFSPPGGFSTDGEMKTRILAIWRKMAEHCRYQLDQDRKVPGSPQADEIWKSSGETWAEAAGDCEDTSILLADMLTTAGFQARVAIGWNGNIGQHAWVVVKVGEKQYLLETTLQKKVGLEDLAEVESVASYYHPEQVFDHDGMFFTTARPDRFGLDYFSPEIWKRVPSRSPDAGLTLR